MIRQRYFLILSFVAILTLVNVGDNAIASHPFHVTRAEIEYNSQRKAFEVALCVWPEDLAKAISKMEKRSIDIDAISETKRDELFKKYVAQSFRFIPSQAEKTDKTKKPSGADIRWVGSEIKVKQGWLYFEVDAKGDATNWSIENEMFFELNDDQMNHLQIRCGKDWTSQTLSSIKPVADWTRKSD